MSQHEIVGLKSDGTNGYSKVKVKPSNNALVVTGPDIETKLDSIVTNTANIKISTDSVNLNVDTLEALTTAGNNTLSSIDNKVILPSVLDSDRLKVYDSAVIGSLAQINNNVDGVEGKLDTINTTLTGGGVVNISTLSTHALQTTINSTITTGNNSIVDNGNKIDAMRASDSLTTIKNAIDTTETTLNAIETSLTNVATDNSILSMRVREDDAHVNRQYLMGVGVVRQDTLTSLAGTDQDTTMLSVNADGALYTAPISHEVSLHSTDRTHLSEIEGAVETIEGCVGLNKMNVNLSSDAVGLATSANQTNGTAKTNIYGNTASDGSGSAYQLHIDSNGVAKTQVVNAPSIIPHSTLNSHTTNDPANSLACGIKARTTQGTATTEQFLVCSSTGSLNVNKKKSFTSEVALITTHTVAGSSTHTTSSFSNDANNEFYLVERNFSGGDVSFEILESIDNTNFFNAMGMIFNDPLDPSASITGIHHTEIKAPYFKIKFTNGNAAARDVTLSYVAVTNA